MRVLLILCLLISSVICGPVDKEYGDNSAGTSFMRQPLSSGNLVSGIGVSSGSGSTLPSLIKPPSGSTGFPAPQDVSSSTAGSGSYPGTNMAVGNVFGGYAGVAPGGSYASGYDSSARVGYGYDSSASGGSYVGGYGGSASTGYGYDSSVSGGSYGGSASAGYGYDSSASGGSYVGGYGGSANTGYGYDSSASGGGYGGSASAGHGYDSSASGGSYAGGYGGSASAGYGYDSSASGGSYSGGYDGSAGSYGSAYGYDAGDDLEPVFSDVSDLDPVYAFSSRSSYQRGSAVFAQTRYTPGEPVPLQMPARRVMSKTTKQSSPKAPTKGAF